MIELLNLMSISSRLGVGIHNNNRAREVKGRWAIIQKGLLIRLKGVQIA